ncbi:MAG: STAS domain-containing protein [Ginsengibacter sp.]
MNFKISTKEILHIISLEETELAANMTEELRTLLLKYLNAQVSNLVVNLENVAKIDLDLAKNLLSIQQEYYDHNHSMVLCGMQKEVENFLEENGLIEQMNVTPSESEACDIVQMEEIERELLS